jgi:type II secretory pathway component PulK
MVLMTVLWIVLIVSFIAFALAAAVRAQVSAIGTSFDSERAVLMAKGAAEAVLYRLQLTDPKSFPDSPMRIEGDTYVFPFDSGEVQVRVEIDGMRIDLNGADEKMLLALFESLGVDEGAELGLVDSILDWRDSDDKARPNGAEAAEYAGIVANGNRIPPNGPFNNMQEVLMVKHMTKEVYFGHTVVDPNTNERRRIPGLQDIATVATGTPTVDANAAPVDVLAALPGITHVLAERMVNERAQKPFAGLGDVARRFPELDEKSLSHLWGSPGHPNVLIATARVQPSGVSKTVRLRIKAEEQKKFYSFDPPLYRLIVVLKFGGWEY